MAMFWVCGGAERGGVRSVYALGDASGGATNASLPKRSPSIPRLVNRLVAPVLLAVAPPLLLGEAETEGDEQGVVS